MRDFARLSLLLAVLLAASVATGQPANDGDLIVTWNLNAGAANVIAVSPTQFTWAAITSPRAGTWVGAVSMARDNMAITISQAYPTSCALARLDRLGNVTNFAQMLGANGSCEDFALDYDGVWIACGTANTWSTVNPTYRLWTITPSGAITTFWSDVGKTKVDHLLAIEIDREVTSAGNYVVSESAFSPVWPSPGYRRRLFAANRTPGPIATLMGSLSYFSFEDIDLEPRSGNYLVCDLFSGVHSVAKTGTAMSLMAKPFYETRSLEVASDGTLWVLGAPTSSTAGTLTLVHLSSSFQPIRTVPLTGVPSLLQGNGLEIYGSRRIACEGSGLPGTSVQVRLRSMKSGDGGKAYALACSFGRRPPSSVPSLQFPNGEFLFLDHTDPLFAATATNALPMVFRRFQGVTGPSGDATATVAIPASFPRNTGITIFAAGVIYDARGVLTVTNTHWFVLN